MSEARLIGGGAARRPRLLLAVNPRAVSGPRAALWDRAATTIAAQAEVVGRLETRGDGGDVARIAAELERGRPEILVVAGGDGTVDDAVAALLRRPREARPVLSIVPFGTANNIARSLGLESIRWGGEAAVDLAVDTGFGERRRHIDVGLVDGRPFAGAVALGMDADILNGRNRLRRALGLSGQRFGYALYLTSCFACLLSPRHGGSARLEIDGVVERRRVFNLIVTNAPIYAGEFRFDGVNDCADGRFDVRAVGGTVEYVRSCYDSWQRHLRFARGERVEASPHLRRATKIHAVFAHPVTAQFDGEELPPAAEFRLEVLPREIEVSVADQARTGAARPTRP